MEGLINSIGGDSLDLNIVCEEVATPATKSNNIKRKKHNKYEKRRAKALRARENKAQKENDHIPSTVASLEKVQETTKVTSLHVDTDKSVEGNDQTTHTESTEEVTGHTDMNKDEIDHVEKDHKEKYTSDSFKQEEQSINHIKQSYPTSSNAWVESSKSRKKSQEVMSKILQDDTARAQYLSTYHARPYEMDRKSGAVSHIEKSKDSMHIFGDDVQDQDLEQSENDVGTLCPFQQCGVHERIAKVLSSDKFKLKRPTLIQRNAWHQMISQESSSGKGQNLFIQSETGSGKTLAFLVPLLQSLAIDQRTKQLKRVDRNVGGTRAIILCPTRELATQTHTTAEKLCLNSFPWLVASCLSGGEKRKSEKARLRKGVSILIATPGRLLDHLEKTDCLLMALKGKLEWIVLDESDRLMDMGLGSQVEQIVQIVRANQPGSGRKRDGITWQSILVSATITKQVEKLSSKLLGGESWLWARAKKNDSDQQLIEKNVDKDEDVPVASELSSAAPQQLTQLHMVVSSKLRLSALIAFLTARVKKNERVIIFMATCDGVDYHYKLFQEMPCILPNDAGTGDTTRSGLFGNACTFYHLHGNIPHRERHDIITNFSKVNQDKGSILITTDVSARGLNLPSVDWIVQYDPPCETADYVHRAGRAARAGKSGYALLFLLPSETQYIEVLKLRGLPDVTALSLSSTLQTAAKLCSELTSEGLHQTGQGNKASDSRVGEAFACAIQTRLENTVMENDRLYKEALAKKVQSNNTDHKKPQQIKKEKREAKHAVGPLLESARAAYHAYVRAYSAKEKAVRHIFSARALHLGHVARSFALKEQPKELSKAQRNAQREESDVIKSTGRKRNNALAFGRTNHNNSNTTATSTASPTGKHSVEEKIRAITEEIPKTQGNKKAKKQRIISFDDEEPKVGLGLSSSHNMQTPDSKEFQNVRARMLAAANKVQSGGMEFF
jgi:ATP-dependent RNA helicase DDX31/DBP7